MSAAKRAIQRCHWAADNELLAAYHDEEWGVPIHDDIHWYEKITLDGAQAGLSWLTILKKREAYRKAFCGFDPKRVAKFTERDMQRLMQDVGIVRNRAKIKSAVTNAKAFLEIQAEHGTFDHYVWRFVEGRPVLNKHKVPTDIPTRSDLSDALSKDLKKRGFSFVGTTIVYAFLQASGVINDHLVTCFRHTQVRAGKRS